LHAIKLFALQQDHACLCRLSMLAEHTKAPVSPAAKASVGPAAPPKQQQQQQQQSVQESTQAAPLPPPVSKLSGSEGKPIGSGVEDNPFERLKQQQQQQAGQPAATDPLALFMQKKKQREEQPLIVATRPRVTAAALSKDSAMMLPTRIPIGARLVSKSNQAGGDAADVKLTLCEVDMAAYHREPMRFPTMADLVARFCGAEANAAALSIVVRVSELAELDRKAGPEQLLPAGFIFHQTTPLDASRLSTVLASVPTNLVYSEPTLLLELLRDCEKQGLSEAARAEVLRAAVLGMGQAHHHHHDLFLELSPAFVPHIGLLLQAFPDTPWAFVYHRCVCAFVCDRMGRLIGCCCVSIGACCT
jgi:hypothetical protein